MMKCYARRASVAAMIGWATFSAAEPQASRHVGLGIPIDMDQSDDEILDEGSYIISYNPKRHAPNWASWNLRITDLGGLPRTGRFRRDPALPAVYEPFGPSTRMRSGFDRGHLCPSADRSRDHEANAQTFRLSNVVAQAHRLNIGPWEALERQERAWASQEGRSVSIVAGPVWDTDGDVATPGYPTPMGLFKVLIVDTDPSTQQTTTGASSVAVYAVLMPNRNEDLAGDWRAYCVPIKKIQEETGYTLFPRIPNRPAFEARSCD